MPNPMIANVVRNTRTKTSGLSICDRCSWVGVPCCRDRGRPFAHSVSRTPGPPGPGRQGSSCDNCPTKCSHRSDSHRTCQVQGPSRGTSCPYLLAKHPQAASEDQQAAGQNNENTAATAARPCPIRSARPQAAWTLTEETAAAQTTHAHRILSFTISRRAACTTTSQTRRIPLTVLAPGSMCPSSNACLAASALGTHASGSECGAHHWGDRRGFPEGAVGRWPAVASVPRTAPLPPGRSPRRSSRTRRCGPPPPLVRDRRLCSRSDPSPPRFIPSRATRSLA